MFRLKLFVPALVLGLVGCSEAPQPKKKEKKPPEPVTGLSAFYKIFPVAKQWSVDIQPLRIECMLLEEMKNQVGKCPAWRVTFASQSKGKKRTFTYSAIEVSATLHEGVFPQGEEGWSGPTAQAKPFLVAALRTDTDAAHETAAKEKKSQDYEKKNPGKPIIYECGLTDRHSDPVWRVIWGESVSSSGYSVFVDASTGKIVETMR